MWMLVPAAATVIALGVLICGLRAVARAAAGLTGALRKTSAAAVASDELSRSAARLGDHAEATRAAADGLRANRTEPPSAQPPQARPR
ncbi:MAG: hypothetical protein F4110_06970 [Acidimicrobiaceae bacterium]|nr:hypothetical protein [Acidimicrobiaceae bacterium]MXZ98450.1 hypothetical protein [Acidimicrobiaceae bacterium]MYB27943.1 hypothetical protein [Acidimicrobiaceae bacterium]MYE76627.1 hypothetical protein [Acidimicrobiaceae bacterium]MYE98555.1 hypothetical protein [Acidimicrobiaceae bacterium]